MSPRSSRAGANPAQPESTQRKPTGCSTLRCPNSTTQTVGTRYQTANWTGPATIVGDARLWGYTAEVLLYMSQTAETAASLPASTMG